MNKSETTRELTAALARRLQRALTAGREELFSVLQDPAAEVLRAALKNRYLEEDHLLALLRRRDLPEDLPKAIHRDARTATSHRLKLALVRNPTTPGPIVQSLLPHLYLFELVDLCFLPGVTPDQKLAAERAIVQRLPATELGNKITLARRATSSVVGELLKEGDLRLVEACLANPRLKELSILQFVNGPRGTAETLSAIARHPKWKNRPNLRLALLKNPKTPSIWHTLLLPSLRTADLRQVAASRRLGPAQKAMVREELQRRGMG
jgi:hypothetical protein